MWTQEEHEYLVEKARAGWSASQIARRVGKTRNAVIGRAHRTGISLGSNGGGVSNTPRPKRGQPIRKKTQYTPRPRSNIAMVPFAETFTQPKKARTKEPTPPPMDMPPDMAAALVAAQDGLSFMHPDKRRKTLETLGLPFDGGYAILDVPSQGCRWVLEDGTMCGCLKDDGSVYCRGHHMIVNPPGKYAGALEMGGFRARYREEPDEDEQAEHVHGEDCGCGPFPDFDHL